MSNLHVSRLSVPYCVMIQGDKVICADQLHYSGFFTLSELEDLKEAVDNSLEFYHSMKVTDDYIKHLDEQAFKVALKEIRDEKREPKPKKVDDLYLILNVERNTLKIGRSNNVHKRLQQLQTASSDKLELLACIEKAGEYEKEVHEKFADLRLEGEWFKYDQRIIDLFKD